MKAFTRGAEGSKSKVFKGQKFSLNTWEIEVSSSKIVRHLKREEAFMK